MAFVCEQYAPASAAALLAEIEVMLVAAGWTLHDNVSATVKVYKSNGEAANRIYEYIWMSLAGNVISLNAYGFWDNAAHTGVCKNVAAGLTITYSAGEKRIIGGDKNIFYAYKIGTFLMFGHVANRIDAKPNATLTAPAVAGSPVVLAVDNIDMSATNETYQIFGPVGEGRYPVKVTVVAPLALTVATLPVNMAIGSKIGASPSIFGISFDTTAFYFTCPYNTSGTGAATAAGSLAAFISTSLLDPNDRLGTGVGTVGLDAMQSILVNDVSAPIGYINTNVLYSPIGTDQAIMADVNLSNAAPLDTGTATAGANFTLTCAGKLWGINAYQNKIVAIMSGTGAGQTRKIASNTIDTLTVGVQWDTNPNATSIFGIFDATYRVLNAGAPGIAFREIINS